MSAVKFEFPAALSTKLREHAKRFKVIALIGATGRGKVTAILETFDAADEFPYIGRFVKDDQKGGKIDLSGAIEICKNLQPNLSGTEIWVIRQAELFTKEAVQHIVANTGTPVILSGIKHVNIDRARCVFMPDHSPKKLVLTMMGQGHLAERADDIVGICGTDLRQINIMIGSAMCGDKDHDTYRARDTQ